VSPRGGASSDALYEPETLKPKSKPYAFGVELGRTKDNVTVKVTCCLQYMVDPDAVDTFYFKLNDPKKIIESHVDDCIRAHVRV
jgi:hypothetical protein